MSDTRFRDFAVFGERCSGTNYVENLISANFTELAQAKDYGWKHGFLNLPYVRPTTVFVVVARDALDWFRSLHRTPHQVAKWGVDCSLSDFLRHEWSCVTNARLFGPPNRKLGLTRETELMWERHPETGQRIENVVRLRGLKLRSLAKLKVISENAIFVRYEDVRDAPEQFVATLSERIGRRSDYIPVERDVSRVVGKYGGDRDVVRPVAEFTKDDLDFILRSLDLDQETAFGYDYGSGFRRREEPRVPASQADYDLGADDFTWSVSSLTSRADI